MLYRRMVRQYSRRTVHSTRKDNSKWITEFTNLNTFPWSYDELCQTILVFGSNILHLNRIDSSLFFLIRKSTLMDLTCSLRNSINVPGENKINFLERKRLCLWIEKPDYRKRGSMWEIQMNAKQKLVIQNKMKNFQPMLAIAIGTISLVAKLPIQ